MGAQSLLNPDRYQTIVAPVENAGAQVVSVLNPANYKQPQSSAAAYSPYYRALLSGNNRFPALDTSGSADWSEGLAKGLGNALQIGNYRQQQAQDLATLDDYQQSIQNQQAQDLALQQRQQQFDDQVTQLKLKDPRYGATPEARYNNVLLDNATGGLYTKSILTPQATAVGGEFGARQVRQAQNQELGDSNITPNTFNTNTPTPSSLNTYQRVTGNKPVTLQDINAADLANTHKTLEIKKTEAELVALPEKLKQEQQYRQTNIEKTLIDNQISRIQAQFEKRNQEIGLKQKQVGYDKDRAELTKLQDGIKLLDDLKTTKKIYSQDPREQAEMQARLSYFGIKYDAPGSNLKTIKLKSGDYALLDTVNGQIGKVDENGKVSSWSPIGN